MYFVDVEQALEEVVTKGQSTKKIIDPTTHGIIDYAYAAVFLGLGVLWRKKNPAASAAAFSVGGVVLAEALLTDYPVGAFGLLSFKTHGRIDQALAAGTWAIPKVLGFADTAEAKVFEASSPIVGAVVGMTDWKALGD